MGDRRRASRGRGSPIHSLGVGTNDLVGEILIGKGRRSLWVAGFFKTAGGNASLLLARWLYDNGRRPSRVSWLSS